MMGKKLKAKIQKRRSATGEGSELSVMTFDGPDRIEKSDRGRKQGSLNVSTSSTRSFVALGNTEVEEPPFDMDDWAIASEFSTRLGACVGIRSHNVAGIGYKLIPNKQSQRIIERSRKDSEEGENKEADELLKVIEEEKRKVEELLEDPHETKPFNSVLTHVVADRERIGNGWLNVATSLVSANGKTQGEPTGLDRIIGFTVRIKKKGKGYIQRTGINTFRHYKVWGDKRIIDAKDGKVFQGPGFLPPARHATELIHLKVESARDTEYGVPRHLSTGPAIAGNRFAGERNASFFENDATPRLAIVVNGPFTLSKDSRDDIREFIERKGKGTENAGRVMIIQAGKKEGSFAEKEDVKIDFHKLTVGISEEAGYLKYQDRTDNEVAEAFGIHPVFFSKDATRASMNVGRSITLDQTFEPDIVELEYLLNKTIIKRLGVTHVWLELLRPKTSDFEGRAGIMKKLERTGGVTPNDVRDFLDKPRFKEPWGDLPLMLAMQQLKVPTERAEGSNLVQGLMNLNRMVEKALYDKIRAGETDDTEL